MSFYIFAVEQLFYELIQVATGKMDCLSDGPTEAEWQQMFDIAKEQNMTGVCYRGVERLFDYGLRAPQDISIDWMADAEMIKEQNVKNTRRTMQVQKRLAEKGMRSAVMLSAAMPLYYGEPLDELRVPDGAVIIVDGEQPNVQKFVRLTGQAVVNERPGCVLLEHWADTPMQLHYMLGMDGKGRKVAKRQKWFQQQADNMFVQKGQFVVPATEVSIVWQLLSIYDSFYASKADMRQLTDLYFLLKEYAAEAVTEKMVTDWKKTLKSLGILSFAEGLMWIMQHVYQIETGTVVCSANAIEGSFILKYIMEHKQNRWRLFCKHPLAAIANIF